MSNEGMESVLRRVQKLLAIANDERANPAEAAAAAHQAEKVMRAYQIEHADVIEAQLKRDDAFGFEDIGGTMNPEARARSTTAWSGILSLAIARLNDCKVAWVRTRERGICLRYSGFKADAQVAVWTHLYLVNQLGMALRKYQNECYGIGRRESEEFRRGFVHALVDKIDKAIEQKKAEMAAQSASRALVVSKANAVAERFGKQKIRSNRFRGGGSVADGYAEGKRVDIGRRGIGSSGGSSPLLAA